MGLRSVLSTFQSVLPMVQSMVVLCLDLGYVAAMVRISRQQYASEHTLKLGFDRFWVLIRHSLIQSFLYMLAAMAAFWISMQVYLLTPLSNALMDMVTLEMADPNVLMELMQDAAFAQQVMTAMLPMLLIFCAVYAALFIPISYSLRMAKYVIIDKPGQGAVFAIKESRKMMKGSRIRLFRLDLSLWWWYAAHGGCGASLLCRCQLFPVLWPVPHCPVRSLLFPAQPDRGGLCPGLQCPEAPGKGQRRGPRQYLPDVT